MDPGWTLSRTLIPSLLRTYGPLFLLASIERGDTGAFAGVWAELGIQFEPEMLHVAREGFRVGVISLPYVGGVEISMCAFVLADGEATGRYFMWSCGAEIGGQPQATLTEFDGTRDVAYTNVAPFERIFDAEIFVREILRIVGPPRRAWLRYRSGPWQFNDFALWPGATIGRDEAAALRVRDKNVSKQQCWVDWRAGSWVIVDANSRNGTRIGGNKVLEHPLAHLDTVEMGDTVMLYLEREMRTKKTTQLPSPVRDDRWAALFLDTGDLMGFDFTDDRRMQDAQPPNDQAYTNHRGLMWGWAGWTGRATWPIASVIDTRWLFPTPELAEAYANVAVVAASEGLPPVASLSHGDSFARFAGPQLDLVSGASVTVVISYVRIGTVVAKLVTSEGTQAAGQIRPELIDGYLTAMVRRVRAKLVPLTR